VTAFAISHHDEPKNPKVDPIKNNRLIPNYLQTCSLRSRRFLGEVAGGEN
jgi:hypothetical protein